MVLEITDKNHTKYHEKVEKGENLVYCEICDYKCKKIATLRIHINTKHPEANYKCVQCANNFQSHHMLEQHIEIKHNCYI